MRRRLIPDQQIAGFAEWSAAAAIPKRQKASGELAVKAWPT
jgi:hypothetical protein